MRKVFYLSTALLLTACGGDSLTDIQNQKIKGSELTWLSAINQFSYCIDSTKKWELKEDTEQRAVALFSCDVPTQALSLYNDKVTARLKEIKYKNSDAGNVKLPELASAFFTVKIIHNKTGKAKKYNEFSVTEKIIGKYDDSNAKDSTRIGSWAKDNINPVDSIELPVTTWGIF